MGATITKLASKEVLLRDVFLHSSVGYYWL